MARPRRDGDQPSAYDRIVEAFWREYRVKSLDQVTVKQVCQAARVARATFYRHFANLAEVLEDIEQSALMHDMAAAIVAAATQPEAAAAVLPTLAGNRERLGRLCVLLSSRGDPLFVRQLKDTMMTELVARLGGATDTMSHQARLVMEFLTSGFTGLLAYLGDAEAEPDPVQAMAAMWPMIERHILPILSDKSFGQSEPYPARRG